MRVALLCDVDQRIYHVGDEAIATATTLELRRRGHQVLRISREEGYGPAGPAPEPRARTLVFPWPIPERAAFLRGVRAALDPAGAARGSADTPAGRQTLALREALRDVDALVIGGGGSLNSRYGWLLDERLATALVARSVGVPVILSGQSLGPWLTLEDRERVRELLQLSSLVGLRDELSTAIARELVPDHPAVRTIVDDAFGLQLPAATRDRVSITLAADADPLEPETADRVLAALLDAIAAATGLPLEMVPHMAEPDGTGIDVDRHARVAALMRTPVSLRPLQSDVEAATHAASSRVVVTTRFHPAVFGLAGGAAVLALPTNRYGLTRLGGVLDSAGLDDAVVPLADLWNPVRDAADVDRIAQVAERLAAEERDPAAREDRRARAEAQRVAHRSWWDHVETVLQTGGDEASQPPQVLPLARPRRTVEHAPVLSAPADAPAVSIITRTKDRPEFLDRAVQDVLSQTRRDWELIVVDDAGRPGAAQTVLDRHARELAGRARVLRREESTGMEAASNAGVRQARAGLIVIHDDDDTWHPTFLQETLAHLEAHPEADAVITQVLAVTERAADGGMVEDEHHVLWPHLQGAHLVDYVRINRHVPICMVYRRAVHERIGPFREDLPVVGDYAFHLQLLQHGRIDTIPKALAQWRLRPSAEGDASNSMFAGAATHREYDARLREAELQRWVAENGLGLPMFITHALREENEELRRELAGLREQMQRIDERSARLEHRTEVALGVVRRVRGRAEGLSRIARRIVPDLRRG
ncbi:polysaccharide pyruvyl transferase family protein [Brachybacterium sp. EF45031]|uniref:polysaccharide pyruvyl transferase family protein n=1 Tax=Brachybacterium sillae TaxID=2810536 RepID=UPI00217F201E|nr:polysaccharide pyruvyl transferase family protein [Brachybacterium sillae]MCS6711214.1 polysaccharide pyruvyl transferase family protein [Brachybacterium sillae]